MTLSKQQAEAAADALLKAGMDERAASKAARAAHLAQPAARPGAVVAGLASAMLGFVATLPFGIPLPAASLGSLVLGVLVGFLVAWRSSRDPRA